MENENSNTPAFTSEQQAQINSLLAAERRQTEARVEAKAAADREVLRLAALEELNKARGVGSSTQHILDTRRAEDAAFALEGEEVRKFFTGPQAGRLSSELKKRDPAGYAKIRALAVKHGILAVQNGKVSMNPARLVKGLPENNSVIRFLSPEEQEALRLVVEPAHAERWAVIVLGFSTGMRAGEQWALKWTEVDSKSKAPHITLIQTKNNDMRHIPLNADALHALEVLKKHAGDSVHVCPRQHYRGWFEIALKAAKIEGVTWHVLRHTFASRLVMAGVDIRTVAALMGHRTLQLTMRYSHLAPAHQVDAVSKIVGFGTSTKTDTAKTVAA